MALNSKDTEALKKGFEAEMLRLEKQLLAQEQQYVNTSKYQRDPIAWLEERYGESRASVCWSLWGDEYIGHTWDGGTKDPLAAAWLAIADNKWAAIESATGTGKTYFLALVVFWFLDCFQDSLVITSAPKEEQLELHLWAEIRRAFKKFKRLRPRAQLTKSLRLYVDRPAKKRGENDEEGLDDWMAVAFTAGVGAGEESATKAQGAHRKHMLIITEETPGMPGPTLKAFENTSVGEHNLILAVGNPDNQTDPLHVFATSPGVVAVTISAYDHPNVVLRKDVIPGAVSQGSIDKRNEQYGKDTNFARSRVRGISPKQSVDSLIQWEWIMNCWPGSREYEELANKPGHGEIQEDFGSINAAGVDVADSENGDKASISWFRRNVLTSLESFACPSANHLAYNLVMPVSEIMQREEKITIYGCSNIHDMQVDASAVGVDSVGVGRGTVSILRDLHYECQSLEGGQYEPVIIKDNEDKPLFNFANLRAQMYWALREAFQHRQIKIGLDFSNETLRKKIVDQLTMIKFVQGTGRLTVEKKVDIKKRSGGKSPDEADSIAYGNWMRMGTYYNPVYGTMPAAPGRK